MFVEHTFSHFKMNDTNQYPWPSRHICNGYWTDRQATPYPQPVWNTLNAPTNKPLIPLVCPYPALGWSPGWLMTPSFPVTPLALAPAPLYPFPTPVPTTEENDLPQLVTDSSPGQDDGPLYTPIQNPWSLLRPMSPYDNTAAPFLTPPALLEHRVSTPFLDVDDRLQTARLRARNEGTIPVLHMAGWKIKGRPSHWRSEYKPNISTRMKSFFEKPACASTIYTLHPLVSYKFPRQFPLLLDLRYSYTQTVFHSPERYCNTVDLYQLTTSPPTHEMQLYHPSLPWNIHIRASTPSGITINDVVFQLCHHLQAFIVDTDFYNDILSSGDRERFIDAYNLRNAGPAGGPAGGLRKVDFLGSQVLFRGLASTREGWLIKTTGLY
ncbi:hypothetical protein BDP27DRAFT_1031864 [Rhodocollybia butyracea]|uniref:DUF6699 domain-containing protein n=1 Tax=Rhodocollybia butyracea TaxID=206335 RepID=A0A9P5Q6A8_9AGAR|nr:hypothetical protein BDP27DRAFT_1031864 [Rhodocollybia butyracea]